MTDIDPWGPARTDRPPRHRTRRHRLNLLTHHQTPRE